MANSQDKIVRTEHLISLNLTGIKLETDFTGLKVNKVRFTTGIGDITYKPRKEAEKISEVAGFTVSQGIKDLYTVSELVTLDPYLVRLNKVIKDKGQVAITMTYKVMTVAYPDGDKDYRFVDERLYKLLYCKAFMKDTSNLTAQEKLKEGRGIEIPDVEEGSDSI